MDVFCEECVYEVQCEGGDDYCDEFDCVVVCCIFDDVEEIWIYEIVDDEVDVEDEIVYCVDYVGGYGFGCQCECEGYFCVDVEVDQWQEQCDQYEVVGGEVYCESGEEDGYCQFCCYDQFFVLFYLVGDEIEYDGGDYVDQYVQGGEEIGECGILFGFFDEDCWYLYCDYCEDVLFVDEEGCGDEYVVVEELVYE